MDGINKNDIYEFCKIDDLDNIKKLLDTFNEQDLSVLGNYPFNEGLKLYSIVQVCSYFGSFRCLKYFLSKCLNVNGLRNNVQVTQLPPCSIICHGVPEKCLDKKSVPNIYNRIYKLLIFYQSDRDCYGKNIKGKLSTLNSTNGINSNNSIMGILNLLKIFFDGTSITDPSMLKNVLETFKSLYWVAFSNGVDISEIKSRIPMVQEVFMFFDGLYNENVHHNNKSLKDIWQNFIGYTYNVFRLYGLENAQNFMEYTPEYKSYLNKDIINCKIKNKDVVKIFRKTLSLREFLDSYNCVRCIKTVCTILKIPSNMQENPDEYKDKIYFMLDNIDEFGSKYVFDESANEKLVAFFGGKDKIDKDNFNSQKQKMIQKAMKEDKSLIGKIMQFQNPWKKVSILDELNEKRKELYASYLSNPDDFLGYTNEIEEYLFNEVFIYEDDYHTIHSIPQKLIEGVSGYDASSGGMEYEVKRKFIGKYNLYAPLMKLEESLEFVKNFSVFNYSTRDLSDYSQMYVSENNKLYKKLFSFDYDAKEFFVFNNNDSFGYDDIWKNINPGWILYFINWFFSDESNPDFFKRDIFPFESFLNDTKIDDTYYEKLTRMNINFFNMIKDIIYDNNLQNINRTFGILKGYGLLITQDLTRVYNFGAEFAKDVFDIVGNLSSDTVKYLISRSFYGLESYNVGIFNALKESLKNNMDLDSVSVNDLINLREFDFIKFMDLSKMDIFNYLKIAEDDVIFKYRKKDINKLELIEELKMVYLWDQSPLSFQNPDDKWLNEIPNSLRYAFGYVYGFSGDSLERYVLSRGVRLY